MEASVQYNDWKGTVAADIADEFVNSMDEYLTLKSQKYDKNIYHCVGCGLRPYGIDKLDVVFYCREIKTGQIVQMCFSQEFGISEILVIFKRFAVVLGEHIDRIEEPRAEITYLD